jgi:hypothetical protein
MKSKTHIPGVRRTVSFGCLVLGLTVAASADVIRRTVIYSPDAVAGWSDFDFDGDAVPELWFKHYGIVHELGGIFYLDVHGSQDTEVLVEGGQVLPLQNGDTVSLTPVLGKWQEVGLQNHIWAINVWALGYSSSPEGSPPSPAQGVGMPGYGDFMGVRFLSDSDWHYGWVRFGILDSSPPLFQSGWPSVLEYAYETFPNTPILVPEPASFALAKAGATGLLLARRRRKLVPAAIS